MLPLLTKAQGFMEAILLTMFYNSFKNIVAAKKSSVVTLWKVKHFYFIIYPYFIHVITSEVMQQSGPAVAGRT